MMPEELSDEQLRRTVRAHFDRVAPQYDAASDRWPWRLIRRREMRSFMALAGDMRGLDVLDLGSGAGQYTKLALSAEAREVVAVDLSPAMLSQLPQSGVIPICADAASLSIERRFDRIFVAGMLEFVADPHVVMVNARRLAKPAALLLVLAPKNDWIARLYRAYHRQHGYHVRLFGEAGLRTLAAATGWQVDRSVTAGPFAVVQCWRPAPDA